MKDLDPILTEHADDLRSRGEADIRIPATCGLGRAGGA